MEKYQAEERKAKQDGNGSKARRMGRICKQYQVGFDASRFHLHQLMSKVSILGRFRHFESCVVLKGRKGKIVVARKENTRDYPFVP